MILQFNTPILLLIFNRPDVTQHVFDQIKKMKPRYLYIGADGPRPGREDDIINCKHTRAIIEQIDWDCELKTLFRDENLGCGFAVCSAITWFFDNVENGIVLEDDCLPDLSFFSFCSELLHKYQDDNNVFLISGTNMQNGIQRGNESYYFSNYPATWGWASWKRAWKHFSYDIPNFHESFESREIDHAFQSIQEKIYWKKKVKLGVEGKQNIWDYQWWFAIWKNKGLGITPNVNLIANIGFRNNPSHLFLKDSCREPSSTGSIQFPMSHPEKIVNKEADKFTYINSYSHSPSRFIRLIRENGIGTILKYSILKFRVS